MARVATVAAMMAQHNQATARTPTHTAAERKAPARDTPGAAQHFAAAGTEKRKVGEVLVHVLQLGDLLDDLGSRLQHLPPVEQLSVRLDQFVVEGTQLWLEESRVLAQFAIFFVVAAGRTAPAAAQAVLLVLGVGVGPVVSP